MYHAHNSPKCCAFTLVELSVSLVIIGLLVGGVMVGQDLIKAATIRSEISDIEKYNTGAATFVAKYGGIPGDLSVTRAVEFSFSSAGDANATGAPGLRDGNAVIEGGASGSTALVGETALFWQDLGKAGLIGGSYTATGTSIATGVNVTTATIGSYLPKTHFRENMLHFMYSNTGRNYYYLASFTTDGSANTLPANAITPLEAKGLDEKMDDGFPATGTVMSMSNLTTVDPGAAPTATVCTTNAVPQVYNVSSGATGATENQVCQLRVRSAF